MSQAILIDGGSEIIELCLEAGIEIVARIDPSTSEEQEAKILQALPKLPLILAATNGTQRQRRVERYQKLGRAFTGVVHPEAKIASDVEIGVGAIVQYGCFVSAGCRIGPFSYLNVQSIMMQDAVVESYCTLEPRALLMNGFKLKSFAIAEAAVTLR